MRKIKLYIAASLNGKIARADGSVDWLESIPNPEKSDYGYADFYDSIDTTIQGNKTYCQILSWDIEFPYAEKKNYVLTRNKDLEPDPCIEYISEDHIAFIQALKKQKGKDIWLIGGGQVNSMLMDAGLIDEIILFIMPIVLPDGIELFEGNPTETHMKLIETRSHSSGVVELRYSCKRS